MGPERHISRRRALLGLLALAAGTAADARSAPPLPARPGAGPFGRGRVWRLTRAGARASFVCGTIHVRDARTLPFRDRLRPLLERSRALALESHLGPVERERFAEAARLEAGTRLDALLPVDLLERLVTRLAREGLDRSTVIGLKPWAALLSITPPAVHPDLATLEEWLLETRAARGMELVALELPDEQVAALDAIPLAHQLALLRHAVAHEDELASQYEDVIAGWLDGDLAALKRHHDAVGLRRPELAGAFAALYRHLVTDRNHVMAHRLFLPLRRGGCLVAVGALHLYGTDGLLALLAQQGYRVERTTS